MILLPFVLVGVQLFDLDHPADIGLLVQVSDAFGQTFQSLSVGMQNWAAVNDFRSVLHRLREWEARLPPRASTVVRPGNGLQERLLV